MTPGRGGLAAAVVLTVLGTPLTSGARAVEIGSDPAQRLEAFLRVSAPVGREAPATAFIRSALGADIPAHTDALGNLWITLGNGTPRRLVVCPLGEPGYAVTAIEPDGYLRLGYVGHPMPAGALATQTLEGHVVTIEGAKGSVSGAVALKSVHLRERLDRSALPFALSDAWVDVGAENADEVNELGIRLLDPVVPEQPPARLANGLVAGPSARIKAACLAAADAARSLHFAPGAGSVVFAWTTQGLMNNSGQDLVVRQHGPFEEVIALDWGFGWSSGDNGIHLQTSAALGTGPLVAGSLEGKLAHAQTAPHQPMPRRAELAGMPPGSLSHLGVPARFIGTPVETVSLADVGQLSAALAAHLRGSTTVPAPHPPPPLASTPWPAEPQAAPSEHDQAAEILADLIASYGTSGDEEAVRRAVLARIPERAHPMVDRAGNIQVHLGPAGASGVLFVAHLDEVGFRVSEILPDGRLEVEIVGGLTPSVWEAQTAVVHGERGPVSAIFEPRRDWWSAEARGLTTPLVVNLGVTSAREAADLGVKVGTSVTMPKRMLRLGRHRAVGRSMDDRVGSTALLLAVRRIDPATLRQPVTFAWSTGEEVGLTGATAIALTLRGDTTRLRVHAVDTFVSSDSPIESHHFADQPLGQGAVLRALDNGLYAPRSLVDFALDLARQHHIPIQIGQTGGSTDGLPFLGVGAAVLPISWPGRYSHSPIEVADFRDIEALIDLIVALATTAGP